MTDLDFVDEQSLLAAARAGDEDACGRLVKRHREGREQFCYLMLGDALLVLEVAGERIAGIDAFIDPSLLPIFGFPAPR